MNDIIHVYFLLSYPLIHELVSNRYFHRLFYHQIQLMYLYHWVFLLMLQNSHQSNVQDSNLYFLSLLDVFYIIHYIFSYFWFISWKYFFHLIQSHIIDSWRKILIFIKSAKFFSFHIFTSKFNRRLMLIYFINNFINIFSHFLSKFDLILNYKHFNKPKSILSDYCNFSLPIQFFIITSIQLNDMF